MNTRLLSVAGSGLLSLCMASSVLALAGEPYIHDPSTIMECDGNYYTYGTGGGGLVSTDGGWTWNRIEEQAGKAARPGGGAAPDAIKIGDRYLVGYSATGGGLGGGHAGRILTMWNNTLDPKSPEFKYSEAVVVASSEADEDCDAIDISLFMDPNGRLWATYGTYFGNIRLVELDPKTGKRIEGNVAVDVAIDCEASCVIYRDGWYYLLGTHGTCCSGANSTYNIRVGRSKNITGPYLDNRGIDMLKGGGKLVVAANGRYIGAGHFGLTDLGNDVQKYSCHYEADLDRGGRSILEIRALLWKDGWPVTGENFVGGTFQIESESSGYSLEMGVDAVSLAPARNRMMAAPGAGGPGAGAPGAGPGGAGRPAGAGAPGAGAPGAPGGMGGGMGMGRNSGPTTPIPDQDVNAVAPNWPNAQVDARLGDYMLLAHQKWAITPVDGVGGSLGSPYFKITIAGTDRALTATADDEVVVMPAYTGSDEQLWRIDQFIDGTYRIMPKNQDKKAEPLLLSAVAYSTPTLIKYDASNDKARWNLRKP